MFIKQGSTIPTIIREILRHRPTNIITTPILRTLLQRHPSHGSSHMDLVQHHRIILQYIPQNKRLKAGVTTIHRRQNHPHSVECPTNPPLLLQPDNMSVELFLQ